jgi:uncharacterized protein YukE
MTDATRLLHNLEAFIKTLEQHHAVLHEESAGLDAAWIHLREVYHGQGAEMFAEAFERVRNTMKAYSEAAVQVIPIMQARIEALKAFDASGGIAL